MRVRFDVLQGPVGGHRMRCEALEKCLVERGHEIVDEDADLLIVDHLPEVSAWDIWAKSTNSEPVCVVMGQHGNVKGEIRFGFGDSWKYKAGEGGLFGWFPLGEPFLTTLTGYQYIILDSKLEKYKPLPKNKNILITMGAADQDHNTEMLLSATEQNLTVIQGPGFNRQIKKRHAGQRVLREPNRDMFLKALATHEIIVCGWGQTMFESLYLGASVVAIPTNPSHTNELYNGILWGFTPFEVWGMLRKHTAKLDARKVKCLDLDGATRTAEWMEMLVEVYG